MTSRNEELHATITARAELDRAFARQLVEEASSVMAKNLTFLLDTQQQQIESERIAAHTAIKEALSEALAPLREEFRQALATERRVIDARFDEVTRRLDVKRDRIDRLEGEVARIAAELSARPTPEKAHATYDGVRRILEHLGLEDDASG